MSHMITRRTCKTRGPVTIKVMMDDKPAAKIPTKIIGPQKLQSVLECDQ